MNQTCCGDLCTNRQTDPENCGICDNTCVVPDQICYEGSCCTPQTVCQPGQCSTVSDGCGGTLACGACPGGQTCCEEVCVDLQSDPANCGACEHACPGGWVCCNGRCSIPCDGGCCGPGANCVNGVCDFSQCNATNCPGENGYECVNGGCFTITPDLSCAGCSSECGGKCTGDVDGSNSYLCAVDYYEGIYYVDCSTNAQCPSGTACYDSYICVQPC